MLTPSVCEFSIVSSQSCQFIFIFSFPFVLKKVTLAKILATDGTVTIQPRREMKETKRLMMSHAKLCYKNASTSHLSFTETIIHFVDFPHLFISSSDLMQHSLFLILCTKPSWQPCFSPSHHHVHSLKNNEITRQEYND